MDRFYRWIADHRRMVTGIAFLAVTGAGVVASGVEVDYSVERFFPSWGEERATFDEYRAVFSREDAQVAFFLATPDGLDPDAHGILESVARIFEAHDLDAVRWAGSVPGLSATLETGRESVVDALRADPIHAGFLWNADGSVHVVQAALPAEMNRDAARRSLEAALTSRIEELDIGARWALSGVPVIRARVPELLEADQRLFLGGGILLFFVLLYGYFRDVGRVFIALATVVPAYLVTLAVMATMGTPVTILTSFIPIVVLVVGICDSTHILQHWHRAREEGADPTEAVVRTYRILTSSCFFTSLTTALGFGCLVATGIGVVMEFGAFTALAVLTTFVSTVTILPALLAFGTSSGAPRARSFVGTERLVRMACSVLSRRSRWVLPAFGVVTAICLVLASRMVIDTRLVDDLKSDTEIMRDLRWIEDAGFGLFQTNLFLRASPGALTDPEMLAWMEDFQRFVEKSDLVASSFGLPDLLASRRNGGGVEPMGPTLDRVRRMAPGVVERVFRPEDSAAQIVVTVRDDGSRVTRPFLQGIDAFLDENPPPAGRADVTGTVRMAHSFSFHLLRSFGPSIVLALGLIYLVMALLFRSFGLGLVAMVPNLFPLVVLGGVMGGAGIPLKPSTILVFSIAFGIAVDDSIHLMGRFTGLLSRGVRRDHALRRALEETGPALIMTTVVVSGGFLLLLPSRFELLYLVGLLTAVTAVAALSADLLAFPALVRRSGRRSRRGTNRDSRGPNRESRGHRRRSRSL